jgi:hypothetical protein
MKIKLEALSEAEGTGIARVDGTLRLVRPPYSSSNAPVLPEESVQDAIMRHGFSASKEEFPSWEDAIDYLNRQVVTVRQSLGKGAPATTPAGAILDVAPPEILAKFLDRVETEMIPRRMFDRADDFLLALLESSAPARFPESRGRALALLQRNRAARRQSEEAQAQIARRDIRFASLERRGELEWSTRVARSIIERGCVFA